MGFRLLSLLRFAFLALPLQAAEPFVPKVIEKY
jgi:hypothetical protein